MSRDMQHHIQNLDLPFSQRDGAVQLPDPIQPEYISKRFRIKLFEAFESFFNTVHNYPHGYDIGQNVGEVLMLYKIDVLEKYPDEVSDSDPYVDWLYIQNLIKTGEYHEILDICEWLLRYSSDSDLSASIVAVFDNNPSAYKIGYKEDEPFIYPANQASAKAIVDAIAHLNSTGQSGILSKISEAATQLNNQAYIASAKFSIDAVEISGSQLAPNKNSLGKVLSEIAQQKLLPNNEIKQILDKINAYANEHARHAKEGTPSIERDEAIYFFGLCAVTADYLASKQQPN